MTTLFLYALCSGAVAGWLAGLFGIGGGLVLVPIFIALFSWQGFPGEYRVIMAVATSLATILVTGLASLRAHHRFGAVPWPVVKTLTPSILLGAWCGAAIAHALPVPMLQTLLALWLLYAGLRMVYPPSLSAAASAPTQWYWRGMGFAIGVLSALTGIGGGTLTVPLLVKRRFPLLNAIAAASACGIPIALSGSLNYIYLGWQQPALPEGSFGFIHLPTFAGVVITSALTAPFGARLAHRLPTARLKRYFALVLIVAAGKLLFA